MNQKNHSLRYDSSIKKRVIVVSLVVAFLLFGGFLPRFKTNASGEGELYLDPRMMSSPLAVGETFPAAIVVNVSSMNKVNVVGMTLLYDQTLLKVTQCAPAASFQGIAGQDPCAPSQGLIRLNLQSVNAEGPSGIVQLATITFQGIRQGSASVQFTSHEIVVKGPDGQSLVYSIIRTLPGSYTVGGSSAPSNPAPSNVSPTRDLTSDPYRISIGTTNPLSISIQGTGGSVPSPTPDSTYNADTPHIQFKATIAGAQNFPELKARLKAVDLIKEVTPAPAEFVSSCHTPGYAAAYYVDVTLVSQGNGIYSPKPGSVFMVAGSQFTITQDGWLPLVGLKEAKPYAFYLKGEKHRDIRVGMNVILEKGIKSTQSFDWTDKPLEPGDLPNPNTGTLQDCVVNSIDLSLISSRIGSTQQLDLSIADVNYDGIVNGNDISKVVLTLSTKPDDDR